MPRGKSGVKRLTVSNYAIPSGSTKICAPNCVCRSRDRRPPDEGAALWAEFDAEMDRLYAIMNVGKEPNLSL